MEKSKFYQIKNITEREYTLVGCDGSVITRPIRDVDKSASTFTIHDAKDGDVLINGSNIFIFHFITGTRLMGYCHVNTDDGRFYDDLGKNECFCLIDAVVNPATKEQRDTLMKAMANAGYTFDFESKELKKIEQKPENFEMSLLEKFKQEVYACAWDKVTTRPEGETQEEYANRWAEQLLSIVRDWADDYIDSKEDSIKRRAYDKGKNDIINEQKSAWSEEDIKKIDTIIGYIASSAGEKLGVLLPCIDWLKSLKDRVQPNPAWSEEDENTRKKIIKFLKEQNYFDGKANEFKEPYKKECDWLKSLKYRAQPQPKQEWSEEDDDVIRTIINLVKSTPTSDLFFCTTKKRCMDWLKSLRPQSKWKPSEEQMEALYEETQKSNRIKDDRIVSLYNDLKKLKE